MALDADEKDICIFLESFPGEFISLREISRRAGGKHRFREDEDWAGPVLMRLVEKGLVEDDKAGHFRIIPRPKSDEKPKWVSPHLKEILKRSGKKFDLGAED